MNPSLVNQPLTINRFLVLFLVLFFLKAGFISLFVTPPWDVSDEIGHLGYIKELAAGKGLPVFRETRMDAEMWDDMAGASGAPPDFNWIAQHPPLYYLYMVPSYWVGDILGDGFLYPLHAGRIWNTVLVVVALLLVYRIILDYTGRRFPALVLSIGVGSIPMVTQTAAGVTNDSMILLVATALGWRWLLFYKHPDSRNLLWLGLVVGLCGLTKYTLLLVMAPVTAFPVLFCFRLGRSFILPVLGFIALGWAPFMGWILRNQVVVGKAMPTMLEHLDFPTKTSYTWLEFFSTYPFFSHMFRSFWGIFGWHGSGRDLNLTTLHIPVSYQCFYAVILSVLAVPSLFFLVRESHRAGKFSGKFLYMVPCFVTLGIYLVDVFPRENFHVSWILYLGIFSTLFAVYLGVLGIWIPGADWGHWRSRIQVEAIVVAAFFTLVIVKQMLDYSNDTGMLRGTHGRYFYAAMGCLLLAWVAPGVPKLFRYRWLGVSLAAAMVLAENWLWLGAVIPFFEAR